MTLVDELTKLNQLHERGSLTDDEFARAKAQLLESPASAATAPPRVNRFRRSKTDHWLGGLCGGLAVETGLDSWIWRLIFTLLFFACGFGILLYILLWIFVPRE
jgi:phage shock protein PspC (stress-responsive transcriptional regulator)